MPARKVQGGYRWGQSGKVYPTKAQAERQGRAIHASGYQDGGIVDVSQDEGMLGRVRNFFVERARRNTEREMMMNEEARRLVMEKYRPSPGQLRTEKANRLFMENYAPSYGQLANFGGMLLPGMGYYDARKGWPSMPDKGQPFSEAFSGENSRTMAENLQLGGWGGYLDAGLQGLGVLGDATYGIPVVGPVLGPTVGTGFKAASAVGKAVRSGIAALGEARKIDVDTFARDESGFFSSTIRALIEQAPPDLKGQGIVDWARANANKGVKPKELEFLGLDEFVAANPNVTTREAVEGISDNKVRISQNVRSNRDVADVLTFESTIPETDPLSGSRLWDGYVDGLKSRLEYYKRHNVNPHDPRNRIEDWVAAEESTARDELLDHYNGKLRWSGSGSLQLSSFDDIPESVIDDLVEDLAKTQYMANPYEMVTPQGGQFDSGTFAFGNEPFGYELFVHGERVTDNRNIAYSRTEAEIQLQDKILVALGMEYEGFRPRPQFKKNVDASLPGGENYREVVFNWDNAPLGHTYGHFDDETQIAHALIRDRKLSDGTDSLHIDELQSDLHTAGSSDGYQWPEKRRIEEVNKIERSLEGTGLTVQLHRIPNMPPWKPGEAIFFPLHNELHPNELRAFPVFKIEGLANELRNGRTSNFGSAEAEVLVESLGAEKIYELADLVRPLEENSRAAPNYPFKDNWYEMVLKNLLLDAAREGKPALSVSGSLPMEARYSDDSSKFYEMLYDKKVPSFMKKLANRYGGEFEQGRLDFDNTFTQGNIEQAMKLPDVLPANIIRITPEMRERILEEGIPSFGGGGIVDITQGTDPSMVDRVGNFMKERM